MSSTPHCYGLLLLITQVISKRRPSDSQSVLWDCNTSLAAAIHQNNPAHHLTKRRTLKRRTAARPAVCWLGDTVSSPAHWGAILHYSSPDKMKCAKLSMHSQVYRLFCYSGEHLVVNHYHTVKGTPTSEWVSVSG